MTAASVGRAAIDVLIRLSLIAWYGWFLLLHRAGYQASGKLSLLLFSYAEAITIVLFVLRRPALSTSRQLWDWLVAAFGTCVVLFYRPVAGPMLPVAEGIVVVGVVLQLASLLSLGRSFGIVPANRGVATGGMYRVVRHPLYAAYTVLYVGYLLANPTLANAGVLVAALIFQVLRIHREEAHLREDPAYRALTLRVPWRLIPKVW